VIKIVIGKKSKEMEREFLLMLRYQSLGEISSFVFLVVEDSYRSSVVGSVNYAGYLLTSRRKSD